MQPWAIVSQSLAARVLDGELRDQRPAERGEQRVAAAVERVGLDRRRDVLARELLARVDDVAVERAEPQRLALDHLVVLAGLAEVDGQADHLGVVGVLDPLQHHARVEAAGVEQQHAVDVLGVGLVAGGARKCGRVLGAHGAEGYRGACSEPGLATPRFLGFGVRSVVASTAGVVWLSAAALLRARR